MFDFLLGNSYIVISYEKKYLRESFNILKQKMDDDSSTITVHVIDFMGFTDTKTFNKSDISDYGSN